MSKYNTESFKIFIAEDDIRYSELLRYHLELNPEYEVKTFSSGKKLIKAMHEKPDVITLDYSLPAHGSCGFSSHQK